MEARIDVDLHVQPRYCKACPIPFTLRDKVEVELKHLQKEGIIEAVQTADWASLLSKRMAWCVITGTTSDSESCLPTRRIPSSQGR